MPRLHVAVLDEELPFPLNSGKRIRSFNLLTRLAKTHRITYIAHRNAEQNELNEATAALRDFDITPLIVERVVPPKSGIGFYARLLKNVFSPLPYSVASHASAAMCRDGSTCTERSARSLALRMDAVCASDVSSPRAVGGDGAQCRIADLAALRGK